MPASPGTLESQASPAALPPSVGRLPVGGPFVVAVSGSWGAECPLGIWVWSSLRVAWAMVGSVEVSGEVLSMVAPVVVSGCEAKESSLVEGEG